MAGSGTLTAYLPGAEPDHVRSEATSSMASGITWPCSTAPTACGCLSMAGKSPIRRSSGGEAKTGQGRTGDRPLADGRDRLRRAGSTTCGCSRGLREIKGVPDGPLDADEQTIGLWRLDKLDAGGSPDESSAEKCRPPSRPRPPLPRSTKRRPSTGAAA